MEPSPTPEPRTEDRPGDELATATNRDVSEGSAADAETELMVEVPPVEAAGPEPVSATDSEATTPASAADEPNRFLPVPTEAPRPARQGIWQRISLRRSARRARGAAAADTDGAVLARLESLEGQVAGIEDHLSLRFDQIEQQFTRVWEIEEQLEALDSIQEQLETLSKGQEASAAAIEKAQKTTQRLAIASLVGVVALAFTGLVVAERLLR